MPGFADGSPSAGLGVVDDYHTHSNHTSKQGKESMTNTNEVAAMATGFPMENTDDAVKRVKQMAREHESNVQYWAITDDAMWPAKPDGPQTLEMMHMRLFAATRLLYEYNGAAGRTVSGVEERREQLKDTILDVAKVLRAHLGTKLRLRPILGERFRELEAA